MNDETRNERLRRLLREADPATPDSGLTLDEVRDMRRTVLTAVPERRRKLLPVFALAGAATVALILLAVLVLRPAPGKAPAPKTPQIAAVPQRPVTQAVQPPPPQEEPRPQPEKKRKKAVIHPKRRVPPEPEPAMMLAQAEGPQQIQFSTPGGTRIIWVLSPGKASK